jgi:predicted alpha/beta-fold hydrolase
MGRAAPISYPSPAWLPSGHLQTIFPALLRKVTGVAYQRVREDTPDGDFLLLDWSFSRSDKRSKNLIILSHGFEGDSHRPYITGMVKAMNGAGHDCLAWNYRSCGGELNQTARFYHSGATDDLATVIAHATSFGYEKIGLIGFSLGGNLTLKYLGEERNRPSEIVRALCFSVPMDLEACSRHLDKPVNWVYQKRFLNSLRLKIAQKALTHPEVVDQSLLSGITSVYSFDNVYTGPLHGFANARDYYNRCSSKRYLSEIKVPVLVIHASNDPMTPAAYLPFDKIATLPHVTLQLTRKGGHCGFPFVQDGMLRYWSEEQAIHYFGPTDGF